MPGPAPLTPERSNQIEAVLDTVGYRFSSAVRHHWKNSTFTTLSEAVEELREGIVATIHCRARGRRSASAHQIRFAADGSIELLRHPGDVDEAAERMLAALGNPMGACTAVALCFPHRLRVEAAGLNTGARQPLDGRLRMLWAAVTWAQDPATVWTPDLVESTLRYGVSLTEARRWAEAGWDVSDARRFWAQWATFEVAEQWRLAGRTDRAAAFAAGRGESPDADQQWLAVGFTAATALRWRKNTDLSPTEAHMWESYGCPPTEVAHIKALPRHVPGFTMDKVMQWCASGVPARASVLRAWWDVTSGDLDLYTRWAPVGIAPVHAYAYESWNKHHPHRVLTPDLVGAYHRAGFATSEPALIARARDVDVTPQMIKAVVGSADSSGYPDAFVQDVLAHARAHGRNEHMSTLKYRIRDNQYGHAGRLLRHLARRVSATGGTARTA